MQKIEQYRSATAMLKKYTSQKNIQVFANRAWYEHVGLRL